MSCPSSRMRPAEGLSTPVSRLITVVLPAPLGPIKPWRAPFSILSETPAIAADQHDQAQHETDPELPMLRGQIGDPVLHQLEDHGPVQPAVEIAGAADDEHEQEIGGALEGKHIERGKGG